MDTVDYLEKAGDESLSAQERAEALVSAMTVEEYPLTIGGTRDCTVWRVRV